MGPVQVLLQATAGFSFNPAMPMAYSSAPIYPQPNAMLVQQPRDLVPRSMMTPMPPLRMGSGPTGGSAYTMPQLPNISLPPDAATMYLAHSLPQHSSVGHLQLDTPAGSMGLTGGAGAMLLNSSGILADPPNPPPAPSNTTLFVSNMPANAGKLFLYETFASFGAIQSVQVLEDSSSTDGGKKCGFVNFVHADSAARAMAVLHQQPPSTSGQLISLEMQPKHK
ncbi:uncharacterized protein HaLaN_01944, partial [Haematococcus lacustris]